MKLYRLEIPVHVRRQIDHLSGHYRQRMKQMIRALPGNPRPGNARQLSGKEQIYRIALDHYRLVYSVEDEVLVIGVLKVGKKRGPEFYADI